MKEHDGDGWARVSVGEVDLALFDYGGEGEPVVLLHGLAGQAREWDETASWLTESHRVVALDQRGHGRSEPRPADVSREAYVGDVVALVRELDLGPVSLVGQSLGGQTAFLTAARHPKRPAPLTCRRSTPRREPCTSAFSASVASGSCSTAGGLSTM